MWCSGAFFKERSGIFNKPDILDLGMKGSTLFLNNFFKESICSLNHWVHTRTTQIHDHIMTAKSSGRQATLLQSNFMMERMGNGQYRSMALPLC